MQMMTRIGKTANTSVFAKFINDEEIIMFCGYLYAYGQVCVK